LKVEGRGSVGTGSAVTQKIGAGKRLPRRKRASEGRKTSRRVGPTGRKSFKKGAKNGGLGSNRDTKEGQLSGRAVLNLMREGRCSRSNVW